MKIHYLAVIFIIIIMPMVIVFSEYMNNQITIINTEVAYDTRLRNSTYDAIKAFQLNTINSTLYTPESRVKNMEGCIDTFYNSLISAFKYDGNKSSIMKQYVPAIVLTMYDGYYVYSPYRNILTNINVNVATGFEDDRIRSGLKPFVSYSCRYKIGAIEYVITYSMDNYVLIDVFDGTNHETHEGYLLGKELVKTAGADTYTYNGIEFKKDKTERLQEYLCLSSEDTSKNKMYYYAVIDGTKYYYGGNKTDGSGPNENDIIFYIDETGSEHVQIKNIERNKDEFEKFYNRIFHNNSAYEYYKNAYELRDWIERSELANLRPSDMVGSKSTTLGKIKSSEFPDYEFNNVAKIFDFDHNIEYSNSDFNTHRRDIIRAIITTNLSTAINGFSDYSDSGEEFLMPKISESDWDLLENNICMVTFLQGLRVGSKPYNSYAVIPNNFNKEYIDEDDIYILKNDYTYTRVNDSVIGSNLQTGLGYEPGLSKINFERRVTSEGIYYNPVSYTQGGKYLPYLGSYGSIVGSSEINSIAYTDMYRYMLKTSITKSLKTAYYTALARERQSSFKYTQNDI